MIGKTLAHYEITELLGKGGMGEVYRAHDRKLGRDVALKILPQELARDAERVARFAREARTLASLQHTNIAAIYGFEEAEGVRFLVMELVEGEDLSQQIARGPVTVDETLRIAQQIATGLEAAHAKNIVHRDLKPANIKITPDGTVKILDFGLARAYTGDAFEGGDPEQSPTITAAVTHAGVILGTAAYMSPEQARGRTTDSRSDIWAFGVILFEMLSGERLFSGETVSDTLASVLKTEVNWSRVPSDLPPRLETLLVRCLDRDRNHRLRDIGEARILLDDELSGAPDTHLASALRSGMFAGGDLSGRGGRRRWPMLAGAVVVGAVLATVALRVLAPPHAPEAPLRKLALDVTDDSSRQSLPVIAPDGHAVAFATPTHLVVRDLSAREARRFPVDDTISDIFWSPDAKQIGYVVRQRVVRVDALTGQQQVVCEGVGAFTSGSGASWGADGMIVFSRAEHDGMFQVSDRGGDPHQLLTIEEGQESDFHDPFVLPGARGVLFVPHTTKNPLSKVEVLADGKRHVLLQLPGQTLSTPVYSATGHILFRRTPTNPGIWAVPFSLDRLEVTGEPFLVAPNGAQPSVADDGTLVYRSGSASSSARLTWNDSHGTEIADAGDIVLNRGYTFPTLTRDGGLGCALVDDEENPDLWTFDIRRGTRTRLTFGEGREEFPAWTPSGDAVLYHIRPTGYGGLDSLRVMSIAADGTAQPDTLAVGCIPTASPDGRFVLFSAPFDPGGLLQADLAYRPMDGSRSDATRLVSATGLQMDARVSPNGDYCAYASSESGQFEIYLTRFPSGQGRWQVSTDGGYWPRWDGSGGHLYYARGNEIVVVDIQLGEGSPSLARPKALMERPALSIATVAAWPPSFDVSDDGQEFLFFRDPKVAPAETGIIVVENWAREFDEKK